MPSTSITAKHGSSCGSVDSHEPHGKESRRRSTILAWILSLSLAIGVAISIWRTTRKIDLSAVKSSKCRPLTGNQDMYGLGIRLGIYLQMMVTAYVDIVQSEQTSLSLAPPTLWFLVAMFVALLTMVRDPSTYAVESYIVISLGNGLTWILMGGITKLDPLTLQETYLTSLGRWFIWGVWRATSSVYWWTLKNTKYKEVETGCGPWGWLIVKVNLTGRFTIVHRVFNMIGCVGLLLALVPYLLGAIVFLTLVMRMTPEELPQDRDVTKKDIVLDYFFVPVGELREIVFGIPSSNMQAPQQSYAIPAVDEENQNIPPGNLGHIDRIMHDIKQKLRKHISEHYLASEPRSQAPTPRMPATTFTNRPGSPNRNPTSSPAPLPESTTTPERNPETTACESMSVTMGTVGTPQPNFNDWIYGYRDRLVTRIRDSKLHTFPFHAFWDTLGIVITILTVEFTLRLNHIDDVYSMNSAGQLVAFVAGLGGAILAITSLYVERRESKITKRADMANASGERRVPMHGFVLASPPMRSFSTRSYTRGMHTKGTVPGGPGVMSEPLPDVNEEAEEE